MKRQRAKDVYKRHVEKMRQKEQQRQREISRWYEELPEARMREDGTYFVGSKEYKQ